MELTASELAEIKERFALALSNVQSLEDLIKFKKYFNFEMDGLAINLIFKDIKG
jgi:hypothetical protein